VDEDEDYNLQVWAGVLPLRLTVGVLVADSRLIRGVEAPRYLTTYSRKRDK
jgi:uncharacterized protein